MSRVTSGERRDVAKGLRYIANCCPPVQCLEQFRGALEDELFTGPGHANYTDIFTRLADLIDPTCEVTLDEELSQELEGEMFRCSKCDAAFPRINGEYRYCPNCGARVVRDEA